MKRRLVGAALAGAMAAGLAVFVQATALSPFIDLQEKGLTLVSDGGGADGGFPTLSVNVGGPVRFALLYWAGRERPCVLDGSGTSCPVPAQPYKDQEVVFDGTAITGTIIGTETQPVSGGGPILNIGYFADVTSLVSAKGPGTHNFAITDGNLASNLWELNGFSLIVAYTNPADPVTYRVIVWDGLDFAFGPDPTPGDTRVTAPVTFNHGANPAPRQAELLIVAGDPDPTRPDQITISNNPTLFNSLDGSEGPRWDNDVHTVSIPAGVSTTTVQVHSAPVDQNPDSILWQVAAIRVAQVDTTRPACPTTLVTGPPAQAITTFQDTGSGLAEILVTKSENADTVVPPFIVGTTDPIVVTSTKIDQTKRARIEIRVTDLAGNVAICDPVHSLAIRETGAPERDTIPDSLTADNKVTVVNGQHGVKKLEVVVNSTVFRLAGLRAGETRTIDISSALFAGDNNTITLIAYGEPGGSADVWIWDGIGNLQ